MQDKALDLNLLNSFRAPAFPGSYFISFEGIEGAGKSTQIIEAKNYLENKGFQVIVLREPGGTSFGEKLRKAILESSSELHPLAEAMLFASSRVQLLDELILEELSKPGQVIIADRYIDSSIAYQGVARGLGVPCILDLHKEFPLNIVPHASFYLEIDIETSKQRQKMRGAPKDYFESRGEKFYQDLVTGYKVSQDLFPDRIVTINAKENKEQVKDQILRKIDELISK